MDESKDILRRSMRLEIGVQIKVAREMRRLTQAQLAKMAGTTQQYLAMIEGGKCNATIDTLSSITTAMAARIRIEAIGHEGESSGTEPYNL